MCLEEQESQELEGSHSTGHTDDQTKLHAIQPEHFAHIKGYGGGTTGRSNRSMFLHAYFPLSKRRYLAPGGHIQVLFKYTIQTRVWL